MIHEVTVASYMLIVGGCTYKYVMFWIHKINIPIKLGDLFLKIVHMRGIPMYEVLKRMVSNYRYCTLQPR